MSSIDVFQTAMDSNGSLGLTNSLLVENYDWVDERLRELYYGYALTSSNADEYESAGLLKERWAWVDHRLEQMCAFSDKNLFVLCPTPITWVNPNLENIQEGFQDKECLIGFKRNRSESSISDYEEEVDRAVKRLRSQSPLPTGKYINKSIDNNIVGNYDEECDLDSDVSSVSFEDSHVVTDDEDEFQQATWDAAAQSLQWFTNCPIVSEDEDTQSYYSYDSY